MSMDRFAALMRRKAVCTVRLLLAVMLVPYVLIAGCGKSVEAIDDTADGFTGAGAVRAGQQIEADARRQINDARDRTNAALEAADGGEAEEQD